MNHLSNTAQYRSLGATSRSAVTIGNFDGCHLGHQSLVRDTLAAGRRLGAEAVAVTFEPRPEAFFRPAKIQPLLFSAEQKTRALMELGLSCQIAQRFDQSFAELAAQTFYEVNLRSHLGALALIVGDDFRFGHRRHGQAKDLADWGQRDGIEVSIGTPVDAHGGRISSTRVREALTLTGDAAAVKAMLGRPYLLEGHIRQGDQLGRQLGVPTANLEETEQLVPRYGIYAGYVWLAPAGDDQARPPVMSCPKDAWPAVFSLGVRPTLDRPNPPVRIEAHLLRGQFGANELYGRRAGYYLEHWLRPEQRFADLGTLTAQIQQDIVEARRLLQA